MGQPTPGSAGVSKISAHDSEVGLMFPTRHLTFSLDLLTAAHAFRQYVIVHELLHLRVRNHGNSSRPCFPFTYRDGEGSAL